MTDATIASPLQRLRTVLDDAVLNVTGGERPRSAPSLERPKQAAHGDFATNAAMLLPKIVGAAPPMIAERLTVALQEHLGDALREVEVAGPGFLNLRLSDAWLDAALADVVAAGERFGAAGVAVPEAIHLEYVSNNPTGPVHIGGARGAAFGSGLANLLDFHGHRVHREYYVNDFGNQVALFGASLQARARGEEPPEEGYQGSYVADVAAEIPDAATRPVDEVAVAGIALMVARQKASLERFRTTFDRWFSERSLHQPRDPAEGSAEPRPSEVDEAFGVLAEQGRSFEQDGALWLRTTESGDDKDRVMRRADGRPTYFASDVAYHYDKRVRGFDRVIDVLGADHHGYIHRLKAAFVALGGDEDRIEILITQFVNLFEDGERAKMSKRAGEFVALDELVDDIGVDAARWYLLARSHDTTIDLDLAEAREQSQENPVYYVQYAHARIRSILQRAADGEVTGAREGDDEADASTAIVDGERELLLALLAWPDEVAEAADRRAPHRIATYALALARQYSAFYRDCPVLAAGVPDEVRARRLDLCRATAAVLAAALGILGVDAPERM
ncbi:Arginyl-tRNA synthetase [Patulibacter medicamentivorans]|uniref:Arginine--tRNA ligase n=1 Tax=Patulibacter medicamentivorans TaxID=1097667 RepID=H0E7T8_9ACTN|nr:arginine--tRNA ligase [Patulibacter medicamentivorans]EHN10256.1 Arginyl-tRNA synthetase [Patulibacter medicamentivorans]